MSYFIDTSVLGRLANASDVQHTVATRAVLELHRRGEVLHVAPQVMVEFRNVATRPVALNGLGLSTADTETLAATFEARFPMLPEAPDIYPAWKALVGALGVIRHQDPPMNQETISVIDAAHEIGLDKRNVFKVLKRPGIEMFLERSATLNHRGRAIAHISLEAFESLRHDAASKTCGDAEVTDCAFI